MFLVIELFKSVPLHYSLMEAKGVTLWQRVLGDGSLKEAAFLRKSNVKVRGDVQKSSQANLIGTRAQHSLKSSIHLLRVRCVYSALTHGKACVHPGRSIVSLVKVV